MQPVPVWRLPTPHIRSRARIALVGVDQALTTWSGDGVAGSALIKRTAFIASARDEFWVEPDQVRIVVQIPRRQVVNIVLLEDAPRGSTRSDSKSSVHPADSGRATARRAPDLACWTSRLRQQEAEQGQHLPPDRRALNVAMTCVNRYSILVARDDPTASRFARVPHRDWSCDPYLVGRAKVRRRRTSDCSPMASRSRAAWQTPRLPLPTRSGRGAQSAIVPDASAPRARSPIGRRHRQGPTLAQTSAEKVDATEPGTDGRRSLN